MNTCCKQFEELISEAGQAGISIILRRLGSDIGFFLQARSYHHDQEDKALGLPRAPEPPRPFYMQIQQGIRYCPFCGKSLKDLVSPDSNEIDRIVDMHRKYELS